MLPAIATVNAAVLDEPAHSSGHASWLSNSARHNSAMELPNDSSASSHRKLSQHRERIVRGPV